MKTPRTRRRDRSRWWASLTASERCRFDALFPDERLWARVAHEAQVQRARWVAP